MFSPAESVDHGSDTERPNHASHTEDGHSQTPQHGVGSCTEGLPVPLYRHILEKPAQFLLNQRKVELGVAEKLHVYGNIPI